MNADTGPDFPGIFLVWWGQARVLSQSRYWGRSGRRERPAREVAGERTPARAQYGEHRVLRMLDAPTLSDEPFPDGPGTFI